ncbi:glycosyltransferase [Acholeplasma hippikon]|uniref:GDP-mannose-dependent alpha-mannosyltransferase n=1 Tax=Acholeplasma hippikon TaxID=264636 RepID=A0A449BIK0_9MOLU|nr:glycosyltransferase [Acholeplasma hippikon]VEU82260.1 GDP-mannose-dependent alpha-mannosyltransferase [Acholeplasma hippikon]
MGKINIGLFIDTFYPMIDGVVKVVDSYATRLSKVANVYVFCPKGRDANYKDKFPYEVIRCKKMPIPLTDYDLPRPKQDKEFMDRLNSLQLDIVHIHSPYAIGEVGVEYAKRRGIPVVGTLHSQYHKDFQMRTKSKLISKVMVKKIVSLLNELDQCYAVNKKIAEIYHGFGLKKEPLVLENGTDFVYSKNQKTVLYLKSKHEIKDEKVFLFVGRIDKIKNIYFLIDVLKELKDKDFKFKMIFIGSGPHTNQLDFKINFYGLKNDVKILGKIADRELLAEYFNMADLFVFPSKYDTSSLVQIEAASQKTPTLFLENTVTASNIIDNRNGYLAKDDVKDYANRIVEIFSDMKAYEQVCENAYKDLYRNWDDLVKKVYQMYLEQISLKNAVNSTR